MPIITIGHRRYQVTAQGLFPLIPGTNIMADSDALPDPEKLAAAEAKAEAKEQKTEADSIADEMSKIAERLKSFGQPRGNK